MPYEFLTDEWMAEATRLRDASGSPATPPAHIIRMNQVITGAPFSQGEDILVHMDTSDGELKMDKGHLENPDLTVTVDYETAKAIFVEQNPQAGMQAFMAGKIKVQGDMTKLMAMQQTAPDPAAVELAQKIKEMTA
ncbi:MAG: SCP2 sterol-binding domain-containing protein [Acidimicrobiales bacterium]